MVPELEREDGIVTAICYSDDPALRGAQVRHTMDAASAAAAAAADTYHTWAVVTAARTVPTRT